MKNLFLIFFALISLRLSGQEVFDSTIHIYSNEVYFDFGKYEIRPDADSVLHDILNYASTREGLIMNITAHTDGIGSIQNNMILAQNRADAVRHFLKENEIFTDTIQAGIFGENKPVASNNSDEGRQLNRRVTVDIYKTKKMTWIEGDVIDQETGKGIEAEIVIRTKDSKDSTKTDQRGHFKSIVPSGEVVGVDVFSKGYFLNTEMLKALPGKISKLKFELDPISVGDQVDIKNFYFVGNQAVLLKKSEPELPKLLKFMQLNKDIKIEIAGHINHPNSPPVTEHSWNYKLSVARAKLVYEYLLERYIPAERMEYKGYGNWEMKFPKARLERYMTLNRRVEIRVLETGKRLSEEERISQEKE